MDNLIDMNECIGAKSKDAKDNSSNGTQTTIKMDCLQSPKISLVHYTHIIQFGNTATQVELPLPRSEIKQTQCLAV